MQMITEVYSKEWIFIYIKIGLSGKGVRIAGAEP